jgi:hypothetical protein
MGFVGFATSLDQTQHFDLFGCAVLVNLVGPDPGPLPLSGTLAVGLSSDPDACPPPCRATPVDPPLGAVRQQELARAVAAAFFDASLKHDAGARCFLRRRLGEENGDAAVSSRRR